MLGMEYYQLHWLGKSIGSPSSQNSFVQYTVFQMIYAEIKGSESSTKLIVYTGKKTRIERKVDFQLFSQNKKLETEGIEPPTFTSWIQ